MANSTGLTKGDFSEEGNSNKELKRYTDKRSSENEIRFYYIYSIDCI